MAAGSRVHEADGPRSTERAGEQAGRPLAERVEVDSPSSTATDGSGHQRALAYNGALDGIRGLAVAAVLVFHGGFEWASGGYLGVSTFFTLSGFLITTLLLTEHRSTGRIDLRRFWSRRMRRLLPAATATLGVVMLTALVTDDGWERALPGDVVASLAQVANWRFLVEDRSYAALFDLPSPVLHYWSLAIEEQFYWVFPAVALGVLTVARGSLRAFAGALGALLGLSALLTVLAEDPEVVYYATPIRMGEILVGALLAVGLLRVDLDRVSRSSPLVWAASGLGVSALIGSVWAWGTLERSSSGLADGGLLLYAVGSACLVGAASVGGPLKRWLSFEPLRLLGVVSYGVYLIHWPIFVLLDAERVDGLLSPLGWEPRGSMLFVLQVALALVVAALSYQFLEQPIRRGRWPVRWPAPALAALSALSVLAAVVVVPQLSEPPEDMFAVAEENLHRLEGLEASDLADDGAVGVTLGDSTLLMTSMGLSEWGFDTSRMVLQFGGGGMGCAIGRGGEVDYRGEAGEIQEGCDEWETQLPAEIAQARDRYGERVTFALLQAGPWDVAERRLEGEDRWLNIGDEDYSEFLYSELETATDLALEEGLVVVWLTSPRIRASGHESLSTDAESDPARMDALNGMVQEIVAQRDDVGVVDLAEWVGSLPVDEDERLRPDGVHFEADTTREVAEWLGPEILETVASFSE